jgi:hypothetical protein
MQMLKTLIVWQFVSYLRPQAAENAMLITGYRYCIDCWLSGKTVRLFVLGTEGSNNVNILTYNG